MRIQEQLSNNKQNKQPLRIEKKNSLKQKQIKNRHLATESSLCKLTVILSLSILKLFLKVIHLCKIVLLLLGPITPF